MCNREELTDATMKALQEQIGKEIDTREDDKRQMARIIESYAKEDNLEAFGKIFITATTDEELMGILRAIIDQYYKHIRSL